MTTRLPTTPPAPTRPATSPTTPPPPPAAPRPITTAARRRSLAEPHVRFWLLAAVVLFIVTLFFLMTSLADWAEDLSIVRHGTPVTATITGIGDDVVGGRGNLSPEYPTTLTFTLNGAEFTVKGHLEGRRDPISLKQQVQIKVDPNAPKNWTYLTDVPPLAPIFLGPALILPFALAALGLSLILRARMLNIWKSGQPHLFIVHATTQTSLAPRSRVVRCRAADGRSTRLVQVFIPRKSAPETGNLLWLIHPPGKPTVALAAMNYEG